ncbi:DUF305 domain-containing protein [Streptomyces sp. HNM0574]|uniref:DUF305 domain-containing protein n=1 Tax=Streptomyces sp. HNM0574 TaxID=2714954 RepID=UPI00146F1479|nr:DUF305 domain-containing protein [Streptomyces sp. HNM0574]NLU69331.1 DUF305 domain-containing protein [Streptomyces sp. HNM0574]
MNQQHTGRKQLRRAAVAVSTVAAALVLAACGGSGESGSDAGEKSKSEQSAGQSKGAEANAADKAFASGMIPHHKQAVEMSELAHSRSDSEQVKKLATEIEDAQGPEIEKLSGWLKAWGEKVPGEGHEGMDHGSMDHGDGMSGMMTDKQMEELKKSSGADFDKQFLAMMVEHHEGAVEMAKKEKADGAYGPAKKLADEIISAQKSEIDQMNTILGKD